MNQTVVTRRMVLDLDTLADETASFPERLDKLLNAVGAPVHGRGRIEWLSEAVGIRRLAAGNWFKSGNPRKSNLYRFADELCKRYQLPVSAAELVTFLHGDKSPLNVGDELTRAGLTGPEQAQVQIVVSKAMSENDCDPLVEENLLLWTKVILRMGRFYVTKKARGQLPDESSLITTAAAFLHLAQQEAI